MCKLSVLILLSSALIVLTNAFISDVVEEFHFVKINDASDEYNFQYKLENGEIYRGKTYILNNPRVNLYLMFGANETIYWVRFSSHEYVYKKSLNKTVRIAQRTDDKIIMRDDFILFELTISSGDLLITPYSTKWNLEKICFTKAENEKKIFDYVISSDNNSRTLNDTTKYSEKNDPHEQQIALVDFPYCDGVYEVKFTDSELQSNETFCKAVSTVLSQHAVFGAITVHDVNSKLLKTLNE